MKALIVLLVMSALLAAANHASPPADGSEDPVTAVVVATGLQRASERVIHGFGMLGSRIIGPGVRSMTVTTERRLAELEPAIRRAPAHNARRAREISRTLMTRDSLAIGHLAAGRPVAAFHEALTARGLVDAVKHHVVEETLR